MQILFAFETDSSLPDAAAKEDYESEQVSGKETIETIKHMRLEIVIVRVLGKQSRMATV